jgi:hypothetical protein
MDYLSGVRLRSREVGRYLICDGGPLGWRP